MNNYKAAAEKTDEAERLLTPPFKKTTSTITPHDNGEHCPMCFNAGYDSGVISRKADERLVSFLQDAAAFIRSAHKDKTWNDNIVLSTLIHDITGLANDEPCFSPRVTGYAQRERERKP